MANTYKSLVDAVCKAGFFATNVQAERNWDRVIVCSKRLPGPRLTGNSFWVSWLGEDWYVGAWGGAVYRITSEKTLLEFTVEWLTLENNATAWDFSAELREKYLLEPVTDSEFRSAIRKQGTKRERPPNPA